MISKLRLWWQKASKPLVAVILMVTVVLLVLLVLIILGYLFNWPWVGLRGVTLYSWLQLLIIPTVLAVTGYVINLTISGSEQVATEQRTQSEREATDLSYANLMDADLSYARLSDAYLSHANLTRTDLTNAQLNFYALDGNEYDKNHGADLSYANLKGATGITIENLEQQAASLKGATMPDGSKHP